VLRAIFVRVDRIR